MSEMIMNVVIDSYRVNVVTVAKITINEPYTRLLFGRLCSNSTLARYEITTNNEKIIAINVRIDTVSFNQMTTVTTKSDLFTLQVTSNFFSLVFRGFSEE